MTKQLCLISVNSSEEKRHCMTKPQLVQVTLLEKTSPYSCHKCLKNRLGFFHLSQVARYICTNSISHSISSREKAQCDSGAPQSGKKQEPGHHETRTALVGGKVLQKQTSFRSQKDLGVIGLC